MDERKSSAAMQWRKTTCGEAREMCEIGTLVFWRPDGVITYSDPEKDLAWYAAP